MRKPLTFIAVVLAILALGAGVAAQSPPRPSAPPTIIVVNATPSNTVDGAALYQAYCASCHGWNGKGGGQAARAIPTPVPDLTQFASVHSSTVHNTNDCQLSIIAALQTGHRGPNDPHVTEGDLDMPNWAPIFKSLSSNQAAAYLRMRNVAQHVAAIQVQR